MKTFHILFELMLTWLYSSIVTHQIAPIFYSIKMISQSSHCGQWGWGISEEPWCKFTPLPGTVGKRIRCCHSCNIGPNCDLDLIPGLGNSICCGAAPRNRTHSFIQHIYWKHIIYQMLRTNRKRWIIAQIIN